MDKSDTNLDKADINLDKPVTKRFRRRFTANPPSADTVSRQSRAATAALAAFGSVPAMTEFLNTHHDQLDGRPLDIAGASAAGLQSVEAAIAAHAVPAA